MLHQPSPSLVRKLVAAGFSEQDAREAVKATKSSARAYDYAAALRKAREYSRQVEWLRVRGVQGPAAREALQTYGDKHMALFAHRHKKHWTIVSDCPFCEQDGPVDRPLESLTTSEKWERWNQAVANMDPAVRAQYLAGIEEQRRVEFIRMSAVQASRSRGRRTGGYSSSSRPMFSGGVGAGAGFGLGLGAGYAGGAYYGAPGYSSSDDCPGYDFGGGGFGGDCGGFGGGDFGGGGDCGGGGGGGCSGGDSGGGGGGC